MSKISSIKSWLDPFAVTLALAATVFYSTRTLSQTPTAPSNATSPTGCLSGYPNGTYQGNRPVTRNEAAAGLNTCLNQTNRLLPVNKADLATRADFQILIDRQIELNRQLRDIRDRLDKQ
jgi:hypothetical protein